MVLSSCVRRKPNERRAGHRGRDALQRCVAGKNQATNGRDQEEGTSLHIRTGDTI